MSRAFLDGLLNARFDDMLDRALQGAPLLMRARRPETVARLIDRARTGPSALEIIDVSVAPTSRNPLLDSAVAFGVNVDSLEALAAAPRLRYALMVADASKETTDRWITLAGTFATARARVGGEGPALAIALAEGRAPKLCQWFDDGDLIGPAEAAVYVRGRRSGSSLLGECADAAAIEVTRGDLADLDRLLDLPEAERFDPCTWLTRQARVADPGALQWRGGEEPCARWLAHADPARLKHFVWRGQVSVLFPWLAEMLRSFLGRHGTRLPPGVIDRETGEPLDVADYEWGHIAFAMRARDRELAACADLLRRMRNELAHGRPTSFADASRAEGHVRRLMAWR